MTVVYAYTEVFVRLPSFIIFRIIGILSKILIHSEGEEIIEYNEGGNKRMPILLR